MTITRRWLTLGLAAAGLLAAAPAPQAADSRTDRIDAVLRQMVEGRSTPGIAVLILENGRPVYQRTLGLRDPRGTAPVAADDLYRMASMTKPITSVAAMILVEDGKIALDDPISKHLPEFASLRVRNADGTVVPASRPPTVRELLTHTAGFSYNFLNRPNVIEAYREARVVDGLADADVGTEEAMRRLAAAPLAFQPGTEWHYSLGTDVLGALIERVTGRPLGSFIAERISRPLGIESFVFRATPGLRDRFVTVTRPAQVTGALGTGIELVARNEAVPYPLTRGQAVMDPERAFAPAAYHSGGAGISGSLGDYARFLQMLANGGELDGARILKPETVALMTTNQTGDMPINLRGPGWGFGLGFSVLLDPAAARIRTPAGTYNWGGIYGTGFWIDPRNKVVGVVLTQTAIIGSGPITNAVREAYYSAE
jgi:CubicO group peptidase (beta-lactamase class C family)